MAMLADRLRFLPLFDSLFNHFSFVFFGALGDFSMAFLLYGPIRIRLSPTDSNRKHIDSSLACITSPR